MYIVLDNDRPADTSPNGAGSKMSKGIGWDNSKFHTLKEAYEYAFKWLGNSYKPDVNVHTALHVELFKKPYPYSSAGDTIEVRQI